MYFMQKWKVKHSPTKWKDGGGDSNEVKTIYESSLKSSTVGPTVQSGGRRSTFLKLRSNGSSVFGFGSKNKGLPRGKELVAAKKSERSDWPVQIHHCNRSMLEPTSIGNYKVLIRINTMAQHQMIHEGSQPVEGYWGRWTQSRITRERVEGSE